MHFDNKRQAKARLALQHHSRAWLMAAGAFVLSFSVGSAQTNPTLKPELRVCADPDDLPFTSRDPATPGLYMDLAQHLADQLGRTLVPVWAATYAPQRMLRTTLLAHRCDLFVGVPADPGFMTHRVVLSQPFMDVGYVLVTPPGSDIKNIAGLGGKRVAVQFNSPVQDMLAQHEDVTAVTVTTAEDGIAAVKDGRAVAALLWGPSAGYLNRTQLGSAYGIMPVMGEAMQWRVAIAFSAKDNALRDDINRALAQDGAYIQTLVAHYGVSAETQAVAAAGPPPSADDSSAETLHLPVITKDTTETPAKPWTPATPATTSPPLTLSPTPTASDLSNGRTLFNSTCAHCHGNDAVEGERRINLRLLHERYLDTMDQVFFYTVTHGRPDKGMPNWTGVYSDDQFKTILAYLHSVQASDSRTSIR